MADRIVAGALLCLSILLAAAAWQWDVRFQSEPLGPKAFPLILSALLFGLCVRLLIYPSAPAADEPRERTHARGQPWLTLGIILAYAFIMVPLGYIVATALMYFLIAMTMQARWPAALASAVSVAAGTHILFVWLLGLDLPPGLLEGVL